MMLARPPRFRVLRALTLGVAGLALAFVACDMQAPIGPAPENEVALEELGANGKSFNVKDGVDGSRLHAAIREHFPELLREAGDTLWTLMFVQDHTGRIVHAYKQAFSREIVELETLERRRATELTASRSRAALRASAERDSAATLRARLLDVRRGSGEIILGGELSVSRDSVERLSGVVRPRTAQAVEEVVARRQLAELEKVAHQRQQELARARLVMPTGRATAEPEVIVRGASRQPLGPRIASQRLGGEDLFETLDPDLIQSVEIIKGRAIEFPATTGGVIWIQLKQRITF